LQGRANKKVYISYTYTDCQWGTVHGFDKSEEVKVLLEPGDIYEKDVYYAIPSFAPAGNYTLHFL